MKKIFKYFFRIIVLPFIAIVILIAAIRNYFWTLWLWISRGGELTMHDDVFNPDTIRQHFEQMKQA